MVEKTEDYNGKVDYGIISIRHDEFASAFDKRFKIKSTAINDSKTRRYSISEIEDKSKKNCCVALVRCTAQGHVAAFQVAGEMIEDLNPKWLVVVGIGGGIPSNEFSLGDVIVADKVPDFSIQSVAHGKPTTFDISGGDLHNKVKALVAHLPAMKKDIKGWNNKTSITVNLPKFDIPDVNSKKLYGDDEWKNDVIESLGKRFPDTKKRRQPIYWTGTIGTSNTLVKDEEFVKALKQGARSIDVFEMEAGGVLSASRTKDRDIPVIIIRGISDVVGLKRDDAWTNYACHSSMAFAHSLIRSGQIIPQDHDGGSDEIDSEDPGMKSVPGSASNALFNKIDSILSSPDQSRLISFILKNEWSIEDLNSLITESPEQASSLLNSMVKHNHGGWFELIGSYICSKMENPSEYILPIVRDESISWGWRNSATNWMRFCNYEEKKRIAMDLSNALKASDSWDIKRLTISCLGNLGGHPEISYIIDSDIALERTYANEKLGSCGILAYLDCHIHGENDSDSRYSLRQMSEIFHATSRLRNPIPHYFSYYKNLLKMNSGRASLLFSHLIKNDHDIELFFALLDALKTNPNIMMMSGLKDLVDMDKFEDIRKHVLMTLAFIPSDTTVLSLENYLPRYPEAIGAFALSIGINNDINRLDDLAKIVAENGQDELVLHYALWALGEITNTDDKLANNYLREWTLYEKSSLCRATAWLGLAKAGCVSHGEINTAFDSATTHIEKNVLGIASAIAGHEEYLERGLHALEKNHMLPWLLEAHLYNDFKTSYKKNVGTSGVILDKLLECT